jgi:predicted acyltransferase
MTTTTPASTRLPSIDLLRGLDVLLMLFVNEMAGVAGTPAFLLHKPARADGMTLTDVVFPAFLFIIGMAIPLALGGRLQRGEPAARVWRHVLARTGALLVLGVLMVNADHASPDGLLSPAAWNILATVGGVLAWSVTPGDRDPASSSRGRRRLLGALLLAAAALLYRAHGGSGFIQIRPYWWGILGLLGWAYLVAAGLYLWVRDRAGLLLGLVALLYGLYIADDVGAWRALVALRPFVHVGTVLGSHAAVVLSGTLLTVMLLNRARAGRPAGAFVPVALLFTAGLAAAGLLLHALHGLHSGFEISKIRATAPWCLLSSALTALVWVGVYALTEVRGFRRWPRAVTIAGENALVAYLLAPLVLSLFTISAFFFHGVNPYEVISHPLWLGTLRSIVFAWAVVRLCGVLRDRGLEMKL